MLAVILKILQIVGIVLLSLLGLVLVLAFLPLVLPVNYCLSATAEAEKKPVAKLKITYFLGLLRARADYTDALYVTVKVLFFTVFQMQIPDKNESEGEEYDLSELDDALEELDKEEEDENPGNREENADPEENIPEEDGISDTEPGNEPENDDVSDEESAKTPDSEEDEEDSDSFTDKIKFKVEEFCDRIKRVRSEIRYYRNVYNSNEAQNALYFIKKRMKRMLSRIRVHADVTFGFDSPDLTGKVYGIYTMFARRFDRKSIVRPDFNRKIFEGEIFCKGRLYIYGLLWIVLKKDVRKIYRSIKHHTGRKENEEAAADKAA